MSARALCTDFIASGRILGQDLASGPDDWDFALGGSSWPLVDVQKRQMRRDYGLVEVSFELTDSEWVCTVIHLQAHRLNIGSDLSALVPPGVVDEYSPIEPVVEFSDVAQELAAAGVDVERILDRSTRDYRRFWVARSESVVHVQGDARDKPGAVWSVGRALGGAVWKKPQG